MFAADNEVGLILTAGAADKLLGVLPRSKVNHSKCANLECSLKDRIQIFLIDEIALLTSKMRGAQTLFH